MDWAVLFLSISVVILSAANIYVHRGNRTLMLLWIISLFTNSVALGAGLLKVLQ